jgi:uncharacterized protein YecE (DUF72 family)
VFATDTPEARDMLALLGTRGVDLVVMDTRGLHSGHSLALADVRGRKPALPVVMRATAMQPLVRCVPHETFDAGHHFVEPWAAQIATWIGEGKRPYFFMHAPATRSRPRTAIRVPRAGAAAPRRRHYRRGRVDRGNSHYCDVRVLP